MAKFWENKEKFKSKKVNKKPDVGRGKKRKTRNAKSKKLCVSIAINPEHIKYEYPMLIKKMKSIRNQTNVSMQHGVI